MASQSLKIALDYDDTYTADRPLWKAFVRSALARGHSVTFVTFRMKDWNDLVKDNKDIEKSAARLGIPIVYTEGKPKKSVFKADIWIDDKPETIFQDYDTLRSSGLFVPKGTIHAQNFDAS